VWYRGRYLHDGAVTTLEEMFNPDRLKPDFVPTGFKGLDKTPPFAATSSDFVSPRPTANR
jgi:hypothetical protein